MPHRPRRPDLDEPISLWPLEGEAVVERLLQDEDESVDDAVEDEDS